MTDGVPPGAECPWLELAYRDLEAVAEGSLSLTVRPESCPPLANHAGTGTRPAGRPVRAGSFTGRIDESPSGTSGTISDGVRTVEFSSDLPAADVTVLLRSLRPFDPGDPRGAPGP